jgi:radical SAM protein with 4Fe4S-binding SPASM domain
MHQLCHNIVFVQGFKNGAIYDFNTERVFWVNDLACKTIVKLIKVDNQFDEEELAYITELSKENLYDPYFIISEYLPIKDNKIALELAWLEITQTCNAKCVHCYQGNCHTAAKNTLPIEKWKQVICKLKEKSVQRIVVIGGEPCTHKDIKEILLCLAEHEINTTLFTNGTLFDESLIQIIVDNSDYIKVKVSLYGHNAIVHDKITTIDGSFEKMVSNLKSLLEQGVQIDIAVVAMKENEEYLDDIRFFAENLGLRYSGYDVIRNVFGGTQNEHSPIKKDVIAKAKFSKPSFYTSKGQFDRNCHQNTCWYGKIAITETGDVLPCVFERNITYGNVLSSSIDEILNSSILKANWFRDFSYIHTCKDCEFRYACRDCRPLGISLNGNISGKNPRCLYNPYTGEWGE